MRIAVAGGTGVVGHCVTEELEAAGHEAVVLTRSAGVDLLTGASLAAALEGVDVIIDAASPDDHGEAAATRFHVTSTRHLHAAGAAAGVKRVLVLSIVGIERAPTGYYAAKLEHERAALAGPLPAMVLRATQFHEYVAQVIGWNAKDGRARIPNCRVQTVAARTVAQRLIDAAADPAAWRERALDVAGPVAADLLDLAEQVVKRFGWDVELSGFCPGTPPGGRLPGPDAWLGGPLFEQWLAGAEAERMKVLL
jgi:uncharacterized protein YbjT (DUF2867 family)